MYVCMHRCVHVCMYICLHMTINLRTCVHTLQLIHSRTYAHITTDGDRIKKCVSFLPILKSKNSNRASGRARNSSSPSFVSVSTICKIVCFLFILIHTSLCRSSPLLYNLLFSSLTFFFFSSLFRNPVLH